jgi:transcription elongation GreA/GreB family factor
MCEPENARIASIGSWVKIQEHGMDEVEVFHLAPVTNARENQISPDNAMGQALLGVQPGDEVTVRGPAGPIKFSILDVGRNRDE